MVEKAFNVEAKTSLSSLLNTTKIDSKCRKSYRSGKKDKANRDNKNYHNQDKDKNKSIYNSATANVNQPQATASKKNKEK